MEQEEPVKRPRGRPRRSSMLPATLANKIEESEDGTDAILGHKFSSMRQAMLEAQEGNNSIEDPDPDPYGFMQELEHEHRVNVLAPEWKAAPDDDLWNRRMLARGRKSKVSRLYLLGFAPAEIAEKIKAPLTMVVKDISSIAGEWRKSYLDDIEILAGRDLATLDYMFSKLAPAIDRGDTKAVTAGVEIIKQRGEILGYKHGVQVDIEQLVRDTAVSHGLDPERAVNFAQRVRVSMK